jgi:hypothetical protein
VIPESKEYAGQFKLKGKKIKYSRLETPVLNRKDRGSTQYWSFGATICSTQDIMKPTPTAYFYKMCNEAGNSIGCERKNIGE